MVGIVPIGDLPTGEKFKGIADFRTLVIARQDQFTRAVTQSPRNFIYVLGSAPGVVDYPVIDAIKKSLFDSKGGFKDLIRTAVLSESFGKN